MRTRVHFLRAVGQDEITRLNAGADVFCLPSFAEGIPAVAMEARATGLSVVTTRIMGIPELVENGAQGLLVPPGRVDRLTDALEQLATLPRRAAPDATGGAAHRWRPSTTSRTRPMRCAPS